MLEGRPKTRERRSGRSRRPLGKWTTYATIIVATGLLAAAGVVLYHSRPQPAGERHRLIRVAQTFVQGTLTAGINAAFADDVETTVEPQPDGKYTVSGWLDVYNQQGDHARQRYMVTISKNSADNWISENLSVIPQ